MFGFGTISVGTVLVNEAKWLFFNDKKAQLAWNAQWSTEAKLGDRIEQGVCQF
jgi:hypothetical protein